MAVLLVLGRGPRDTIHIPSGPGAPDLWPIPFREITGTVGTTLGQLFDSEHASFRRPQLNATNLLGQAQAF